MADATGASGDQLSRGNEPSFETGPEVGDDPAVPATVVTVNIKTLNGPDFELAVERNVLVSDLKAKVRERTDVEEARQRLIYRGKVLADAEPLSTYKVEDGHYLHMVARPQGVPPPLTSATVGPTPAAGDGHASQAAAGTPVGTRPILSAATAARVERTLGERLLMGMGLPPFAQEEDGGGLQQSGRAAGIPAGGGGGDAEVNNAAEALGSGDFLSNMFGLGADNAHPQHGARTGWTEGRGTRGQRRDGASGGTGSGAAAGGGAGGQADLEHVRQGLLTLHTLLSGSTARREETQEHSAGAGLRGTGTAGNALEDRPPGAEVETGKGSALDTRQESTDAAEEHRNPTASMATVGEKGASGAGAATCPGKSNGAPAASDGGPCGDKSVSSSDGQPLASSDEGAEKECVENTEGGSTRAGDYEETDGGDAPSLGPLLGDHAPSRHWPLLAQRSNGVVSSSEGLPQLLSSSGESSPDDGASNGWERQRHVNREAHRGARSLSPQPNRFRMRDFHDRGGDDGNEEDDTDDDDGEEERKDEHDFGEVGERGERQQRVTRKFFVGQWLDVKDTVNNWLEATVMNITDSGTKLQIHYNGWPPRWDEWLSWDSPRIAPFRTRTQHLPHSQHVSPAPISAVRNAPITGMDDVRVVMPEVSRVIREISPMVEELSASYARNLEQDLSNSPTGERAVSHTLPWARQRFQRQERGERRNDAPASGETDMGVQATADLAGEIAPLLDRLGRMLTDVAPHLARLSARAEVDRAEALASPERRTGTDMERTNVAEQPRGVLREADIRRLGVQESGTRRLRGPGRRSVAVGRASPDAAEDTSAAFRQLVSTSSPAPTSSNINIHIHAIVPLRAPPSPPPPPPPTASASTEATPTRADRPPLAVAGGRNSPWGGGSIDTVGGSASIVAAARAAAASRAAAAGIAAAARDPSDATSEVVTPRRLSGGIVTESIRSGGERDGIGAVATGIATSGPVFDRSPSLGSSVSFDVSGVSASPLTVSTPGSAATVHSEPARTPSSATSVGAAAAVSDSGTVAFNPAGDAATAGPGGGGGQRRSGGWRGLLRALGVGNSSNTRVGGRRDGLEGDQNI